MKKSYQVIYLPEAEKFFRKAPKNLLSQIFHQLEQIALDPFAPNHNLKKLKDPLHGYRLRIGNFRAIYLLDNGQKRLIVVKIKHRSAIYKK